MCRLKNLRKIVIPLWRSGRRVEATSSPGWRSRRRASRPNFCSGHLYVGSSNSACPAHPPKSNSQPSPPTRKPTLSTVPPSLSRSSPFVLAEAQPSSPGVTPKPPSLAAHVRATGRSHERHVLTAARTPRAPLQAGIASAAAVVQWSLSLVFACPPLPGIYPQLSSQVALSNTDQLTPCPSLALSGVSRCQSE